MGLFLYFIFTRRDICIQSLLWLISFQFVAVGIDPSSLSEEQRETLKFKMQNHVIKHLKQSLYSWRPVLYNEHNSLLYMVSRSAPEFAALQKIFMEVKTREPDFQPRSMFDFGSGIGTATWWATVETVGVVRVGYVTVIYMLHEGSWVNL